MTLVVVLLFGLGSVLVISAIETDPTTGKSVSVLQTIQDVWNNKVDFSQPATTPGGGAAANGGGSAGQFTYVPPSPSTSTLVTQQLSYQNAATADYLKTRQV